MSEPFKDTVWIGLSNCDEHRDRRTDFARKIREQLADFQVLMVDGGTLFHEALCCFQNGAFQGTAIMCRASLEAAIYTAVTRTPRMPKAGWGPMSSSIDLSSIEDRWGSIVKSAKDRNLLDKSTEDLIKQVRDRANFVVHWGQQLDRALLLNREPGVQRPVNLWVPESEAMGILEKSLKVLNAVISNYIAKNQQLS